MKRDSCYVLRRDFWNTFYVFRFTAHLGKHPNGKMSVTRIDLHPVVRFDTGFSVSEAELAQMHDRAHRYCFIANTLADSVEINIL